MRGNLATVNRLIVFLALPFLVVACMDDIPVTSPEEVTKEEVTEPARNRNVVASLTCTAHVAAGEISCGPSSVVAGETEPGPQRVILGGQNQYVTLTSSSVSYDGSQFFQADVTVTNLITQGLGSPDGGITTTGVRVFHHTGPNVTSGTGTVTVNNADGTGTFTGSNQPYFEYLEYVPANGTTSPKTWIWDVPSSVTTFGFTVFVDADVWGENGYVDVTPGSGFTTVGGATIPLSATVRDVVDRDIGGTVTWTSSDPSIASVDPSTGVVTAVSDGVVDIIGSTGGPEADGTSRITVNPFVAGFQIELHFLTPMTASQEAAFNSAAARWESLITGDLSPVLLTWGGNECGMPIDEIVDDLAINAVLDSIDGPGNILGSAGPCFVRTTGGLPIYGVMTFDTADVANMEANNQFGDVVLHEMGHVLGMGTSRWISMGLLSDDNGLLTDCFPVADDPPPPLTTDPYFNGPLAIAAFNSNGGGTYVGNKVPVENDFGPGTRCGHWRESVLNDELMTGFIEAPMTPIPLSEVTVKALADMGYTVAASGWDTWTCPFCAPPALGAPVADATQLQLLDDMWQGPLYGVDEEGRITLLRPDRRR
jgi:hypothetical protein